MQLNMRYLRIISFEILNRKYTELSILAKIYLSNFNIVSVLHWLNCIKVSVERWPHCHVRYCLISSFSISPKRFCKQRFYYRFYVFFIFFHNLFCDWRFFTSVVISFTWATIKIKDYWTELNWTDRCESSRIWSADIWSERERCSSKLTQSC